MAENCVFLSHDPLHMYTRWKATRLGLLEPPLLWPYLITGSRTRPIARIIFVTNFFWHFLGIWKKWLFSALEIDFEDLALTRVCEHLQRPYALPDTRKKPLSNFLFHIWRLYSVCTWVWAGFPKLPEMGSERTEITEKKKGGVYFSQN